ncbi:WD40 repeat-like protein, partial [Aureobasidium melanogenum]
MAPRGPTSAFESETFGQDASFRLEQPVGSMSISPSGRDVALASKEGLHIIDLDSPYSPPRYLPHRTPWEVADVQWSPFAVRDYWVVSTSNQKALVWNLEARSWQDWIEFVLHGHTRAITDINFSAHNPDVLATCAVDSFVHCWDLRAPLRPVNSFSDWFAGATQVKWSRQDEHVVASSHDKFLHIWDDRNGAYPVRTIQAHATKISGVDWNRYHPGKIITCSLDKTIKFWNLNHEENMPERIIETSFPIRRARHTPFGWGLLVMPQRGNSDLHLYDRRPVNGVLESGPVPPVATFAGHDGHVKEFLWRSRGTIADGVDHRDFQLVSWGTDRELRLHALDPSIYANVGYEKGVSKVQRLNFTRRGAVYKSFRDDPADSDSPLEQPPRSEMFPRPSQVMQLRYRMSTSAAMNKVPVSRFRSWVQGRQTHRQGMHGRANARQRADPIAWLKNVKISSWDTDTLAEEIRQVGEKFKKVDFEVVDISRRKAVMSLQAPWGENQSQVYLRVEMRFPKSYPRNANAVLSLQKSGFVDDETHKLISTELNTISEIYASRKRGCLEAVLRYLLREQDLEQIIGWVLGDFLTESKVLDAAAAPADDSSSDDDEQMDGIRDGLEASANILVPLAKGCGAIWSQTGKLVCFFPAKSKEPISLLSTLGVKDLENSDSSGLFEGFGRMHASSPARRAVARTKSSDEDSDSGTSDSSWLSSSSSSSSFETEQNARGVSSYPAGVSGLHQRSRSPDRSNNSTTGLNKLNDNPRLCYISIESFENLVPSKRELGLEYKIFGDGPQLCKHNAGIARKACLEDLASVWTLLGLILDDTVPLEVLPDLSQGAPIDISVLARNVVTKSSLGYSSAGVVGNKALGRTRWGNHPLASTYLLPAIFDHFERLGDVQMLAMMSCVFASVANQGAIPGDPVIDPCVGFPNNTPFPRSDYFPSKAVAKAFLQNDLASEGYVLVDSMNAPPCPGMHTTGIHPLHGQTRPYNSGARQTSQFSSHAHSFIADDASDHAQSQSTTVSLSTSPEGNRSSHRPASSIPYSSARASLSALTQSYSSNSPPNQSSSSGVAPGLKKYSPSGSLAPSWVSSSLFGGQSSSRQPRTSFQGSEAASQDSREVGPRPSITSSAFRNSRKDSARRSGNKGHDSPKPVAGTSSEVQGTTEEKKVPKRKRVKTHLFNQDKFDLDGYALSPLLGPTLEQRCSGYRASYAHLLDVWQLPIQRCEMLKFDGLSAEHLSAANHHFPPGPHHLPSVSPGMHLERPLRRKTMTAAARAPSPGLTILRCCRHCGDPLAPIEKNGIPIGWQCVNPVCSAALKVPERSTCVVCNSSIDGLAVPCLQCGHLTCYDCAQGWFGVRRISKSGTDRIPISRRPSAEETTSPSKDDPVDVVAHGGIARHDQADDDDHIGDAREDKDPDHDEDLDEHNSCPTGCGCPCASLSAVNAPSPPTARFLLKDKPDSNVESEARSLGLAAAPPPSSSRVRSELHRSASELTPGHGDLTADAALAAFLALTQRHQRAKSTTAAASGRNGLHSGGTDMQSGDDPPGGGGGAEEAVRDDDDDHVSKASAAEDDDVRFNPWVGSKIATLGRGIGAGLSRGLSSKASDGTIRRIK